MEQKSNLTVYISVIGQYILKRFDIIQIRKGRLNMNKKFLASVIATSMLASGMSVFANDAEIMPINEETPVVQPLENQSAITSETVTVTKDGIEADEDTLFYNNSGEEIEADDIKEGSNVIIYKDANGKVLAVILVEDGTPGGADLDLYQKSDIFADLINAKGDLTLHISDEIEITDRDGNKVSSDELEGKNLLVFYTQVALSLPGQTTPEKIIVLGEGEPAAEEPEVVSAGIEAEEVTVGADGLDIDESVLLYNTAGEKIEAADIKEGSKVIVFTDKDGNTLAAVLTDEENAGSVDLDVYLENGDGDSLISSKRTLVLNIGDETEITDVNGEKVSADELADKTLLVFYTITTRSLPPQTTPEKIIVLDEAENTEDNTQEFEKTYTVAAEDVVDRDGTAMLPLRDVAEALGYEVGWSDLLQRITVGTTPMGVNFVIGVNEYNKARMTPAALEQAPELIVSGDYGVTYVPASFFAEIIEADVQQNADGSVTVRQ